MQDHNELKLSEMAWRTPVTAIRRISERPAAFRLGLMTGAAPC